jgi:hypothetical protein
MANVLVWLPGMSFHQYLTSIEEEFKAAVISFVFSSAVAPPAVVLIIDHTFLKKLFRLNKKSTMILLKILEKAPFLAVTFLDSTMGGPDDEPSLGPYLPPYQYVRFQKLCKCLGRNASVQVAHFFYRDGIGSLFAKAVKCLSQVYSFILVTTPEHTLHGEDFVESRTTRCSL